MPDAITADPRTTERTLPTFEEVEARLKAFEGEERKRLGLDAGPKHWHDPNPQHFIKDQRADTKVLFGGLTAMHDAFLEAGLRTLGYRTQALDTPGNEALQLGKEFGNRGQCNPTYFTSGNLLRHLMRLRDVEGMSVEDIIDKHVFVTLSGCGPCRFGSYATEYRKALRDAGFEGFRIFSVSNNVVAQQAAEEAGLAFTPRFYLKLLKCLLTADVMNVIGYRMRPYEVVAGATDAALEKCKTIICEALANGRSVYLALRRCRKLLAKVEVNRLQPKPKVAIIGEFWAMTTEGDGNYGLQRFLEAEGAECDIQTVIAWALYQFWQFQFDTRERMMLRRHDHEKHLSESGSPVKLLVLVRIARFVFERWFYSFARAAGLNGYRLTDIDHVACLADKWYANELRGGEGNREVGEVVETVEEKKAHMILSVKPFGCMPSSGVSDGVQSLVAARYPEANFIPVETTGDGAVNVYSRVQMALFKARTQAQEEYEAALAATGVSAEEAARRAEVASRKLKRSLHYPRHVVAGTAANCVYELG
jgi:predicted nucleotide-binding protein (sugar kinase/HSP70/actin superfamily)